MLDAAPDCGAAAVTVAAGARAAGTALEAGQAVRVTVCYSEPSLVGKVLLIDKISQNGLAALRKATASDFEKVNQEGKEGLS